MRVWGINVASLDIDASTIWLSLWLSAPATTRPALSTGFRSTTSATAFGKEDCLFQEIQYTLQPADPTPRPVNLATAASRLASPPLTRHALDRVWIKLTMLGYLAACWHAGA